MEENTNVVNNSTTQEKEGSKFGWGVLGFFIPLVGLILFLVWMKDKKRAAKAAGIGALIGFIFSIISTVLLITFFGAILGIGLSEYDNNKGNYNKTPIVEEDTKNEEDEVDSCIGKIEKGSTKYEYILDLNNDYTECDTITYKINNYFTIKTERKVGSTHADIYINDVKNENIIYNKNKLKVAVSGKTLITNTMHQTTVNGGISTTLINSNGEQYNFKTNPEGRGRDINMLNTDGMLDEDFSVNSNGDLIVKGTQLHDICVNINDNCVRDICSIPYEELINSNNVTEDYPINIEFLYKLDENGLFSFDYSNKNTTKTIKDFYNEICNR